MTADPCARCGGPTPTYDFDHDSTFWSWFTTVTETVTTRRVGLRSVLYRRNPARGSGVLRSEEERPLCSDCSYQLVGRFLQGRSVDALPGKEGR